MKKLINRLEKLENIIVDEKDKGKFGIFVEDSKNMTIQFGNEKIFYETIEERDRIIEVLEKKFNIRGGFHVQIVTSKNDLNKF